MALSEQQKQAAEKIFGKELAAQIIKPAEDATKELEEAGVAHKEASEEVIQEEAKPNPEFQLVLDALAQMDLPGLSQTIQNLAEGQNQLNARLDDLATQVKSLKETEALKQKTEMPRFAWSMMNRAITSEKTVVTEDDPLLKMKPDETKPAVQDNSVAGHIFPQQRR